MGRESIKRFVHEAVEEALKLEAALARLHTPQRVVLMHYSPVPSTGEGEPREIYPFLGSSRLEEPLTHYPVTAVFHGHPHHGRAEGETRSGLQRRGAASPARLPRAAALQAARASGRAAEPAAQR